MAQVNTGLGWEAKAEWLKESAGVIASMDKLQFTNYPDAPVLPKLADKNQIINDGLLIGTNNNYNGPFEVYAASNASGTILCTTVTYADYFAANIASCDVWIAYKNTRTQSWGFAIELSLSRTYGGYHYNTAQNNNALINVTQNIPSISSPNSEIAVTSKQIAKLNAGYAVACVAQWYTPEGAELISPVLISNVPTLTALSYDGQTPAADTTTFDFLYDGIRFYMTIIGGNSEPLTATVEYADLRQFAAALPQKVFTLIASESFSNIRVIDSPDPYEAETGHSEEDGGDGDETEDDPVDEETLPIPAVVGLGFSTIYVPTQTDLYNLAAYLWGGNLDLDNFLKLFANPMDSILGLSAVPLVLSGTYEPIYLGGQLLQGITMPRYTGRTAVKVDMGTATITERWGSYLDYDPYTELAVYVPFVGIKNIKADDVMGKTIRLMYDIDILSGACIAYIRPEGGSPLYEWSGQCAMQIPITGANWDNIFNSAIHTVATLGGALFAPASAPVLGGAVASAASQAIAAKPRIERSGAMNGVTGFLGQLRPYIIRTIPEAYIPNDQNKFIGYPSYVSVNLGSLTGYNEIASIHLENIPATGDELSELESILKGGAIF